MDPRLRQAVEDYEFRRRENQHLNFVNLFKLAFGFSPPAREVTHLSDDTFEFAGEVWKVPSINALYVRRIHTNKLSSRELWYLIPNPHHYAKLVDDEPLTDGVEL